VKIPGYERYEIFESSRIKGLRGRFLKPGNYGGYDTVGLYKEGEEYPTTLYVHRLMAASFLGLDLSDSSTQVDHLDMVKTNNAVSNLRLCTQSENLKSREKALNQQDNDEVKRCRMCNLLISTSSFGQRKSGGLNSYCKSCWSAYVQKRRITQPVK
jgi:hypothetical protein